MNNSVLKKEKSPNSKISEKFKDIFSLKIFRYSLIKMLKAPSTYVILVFTFAISFLLVLIMPMTISRDFSVNLNDQINTQLVMYLWMFFIFYFVFSSMYIGFKSVQIIRDELDDGTLLMEHY